MDRSAFFFAAVISFVAPMAVLCQQDTVYLVGVIHGQRAGDNFGVVAGVGDVTGDGKPDFMISSYLSKTINLYRGGTTIDTIPYLRFTGAQFSTLGDINGDGYNDFCIADGKRNFVTLDVEYFAKVYWGGPAVDTLPDFVISMALYPPAGISIGNIGDLNNDGIAELMVGFPIESDGMGRAYLYWGKNDPDSLPAVIFCGEKIFDTYGKCFCGIGDINHDGYCDFAIGIINLLATSGAGYAKIYLGGKTISTLPHKTITGPILFGMDIVNCGDLNKDGKNEWQILSSGEKRIYLYSDLALLLSLRGESICRTGDINGDGFLDYLIGYKSYRNKDSAIVGCVRGYYGSVSLDTLPNFMLEGEHEGDCFGETVSILGDINGDGWEEFAVAAPSWPDYNNPVGKVYIYSKKPLSAVQERFPDGKKQPALRIQNYPNPFNNQTTVSFNLPDAGVVHLEVFSLEGRKVEDLWNGWLTPGTHRYRFNAKALASGVYFYRLRTHAGIIQRPMLLIK